jgi:rRNA-processing protein EBP2
VQAALVERAQEIRGDDLPWIETLDTCSYEINVEDAHDDLKREVAFYNMALACVKDSKEKLAELEVPYKRPDDYYAEMIKSDDHMANIKDRLIYEQRKMAAFEMRKEQQQHKKRAKQVQGEKNKQKIDSKVAQLDAVEEWKRGARDRDHNMAVRADDDFEQFMANKNKPTPNPRSAKSHKRANHDAAYGHGGSKRFSRQNDSQSYGDSDGYSAKRNKTPFAGTSKKGKPNRPGKDARAGKKKR